MIRKELKQVLRDVIREQYGIEMPDVSISVPENSDYGDYTTNAAMILAKRTPERSAPLGFLKRLLPAFIQRYFRSGDQMNPITIAERIAPEIDRRISYLTSDSVSPGFTNFRIQDDKVLEGLRDCLMHPREWGGSNIGNDKTVMVEYFQLNIAKPPHVGHIRSAIIGDALKRIFLSQGYHSVSDTHVGDWGTQFGFLLLRYKGLETIQEQHLFITDIQSTARAYADIVTRALTEPEKREAAKKEFAKLEQGDLENRRIWEQLVESSIQELKKSAARLGLMPFDEHRGESFYEDKMLPIVELALEKGIAKKTEDGAVIVDLTGEKLDEAVLIKSDGASTYLLRDLATIRYRKERWDFWKNLYVVDVRQSHHFKQVFRVAELLGFEGVGESEHVSYGFVKLPEGMLSTRAGNVISLEKVLDEAVEKAREAIRAKNPDLADADTVARAVGIGALKYFDLSHHRTSDIVFSWDRALSFEGNTGPYLQYTYARLKSILRKLQATSYKLQAPVNSEMDTLERRLAVLTLRFPEAIEDTLAIYSPHVLAAYLYDLAKTANEFYHSHPVMQEEDETKKNLRLALISAIAITLARGLYLLGIEAPEEM